MSARGSVLLVGSEGSMGRRYQAIFRDLGVVVTGIDQGYNPEWALQDTRRGNYRGVVIASPTPTHEAYVRALALSGVPILCEKPVTTDLDVLDELLRCPAPLDMMRQYSLLDDPANSGDTVYDFYHTGGDGLAWDCMQLVGLARGTVRVDDKSPVWRCTLNGKPLTLDDVGFAYYGYVQRWLSVPEGDRAEIRRMHQLAAARCAAGRRGAEQ